MVWLNLLTQHASEQLLCCLRLGPGTMWRWWQLIRSFPLPSKYLKVCSQKFAAAAVTSVSDSVRPHRRQPTRLRCPWDSPGKNTGAGCHFPLQCMQVKSESEVAQSCPTLSDPMDCSLPGSSVHGIFQARVLEWVAIAVSVQKVKNLDM